MSNPLQSSDFGYLSIPERILIVEQIWDSIAAEQASLPLTEAQKTELDRRLDACRQSPKKVASWEEVKAHIHSPFVVPPSGGNSAT
jgi:putative addiction module component (TIGR02574 family)